MQYKTILFDLDGTLTDSAPGILNSVRYGCRRIGIPVPDEATLRRFLGPPLIDSFHNLCGLNDADTDRAVAAFREYFPDKGLFENEVYPGIPALLADLHARGCQLVLATSKPEEYARRIMEHFDLAQYFTAICGATLDETRTDKAEVIAYALDTIGLTDRPALSWSVTVSTMSSARRKTPCPASAPSTATAPAKNCNPPVPPPSRIPRKTCINCCWDKSNGRQPALSPIFYWSRSL